MFRLESFGFRKRKKKKKGCNEDYRGVSNWYYVSISLIALIYVFTIAPKNHIFKSRKGSDYLIHREKVNKTEVLSLRSPRTFPTRNLPKTTLPKLFKPSNNCTPCQVSYITNGFVRTRRSVPIS